MEASRFYFFFSKIYHSWEIHSCFYLFLHQQKDRTNELISNLVHFISLEDAAGPSRGRGLVVFQHLQDLQERVGGLSAPSAPAGSFSTCRVDVLKSLPCNILLEEITCSPCLPETQCCLDHNLNVVFFVLFCFFEMLKVAKGQKCTVLGLGRKGLTSSGLVSCFLL